MLTAQPKLPKPQELTQEDKAARSTTRIGEVIGSHDALLGQDRARRHEKQHEKDRAERMLRLQQENAKAWAGLVMPPVPGNPLEQYNGPQAQQNLAAHPQHDALVQAALGKFIQRIGALTSARGAENTIAAPNGAVDLASRLRQDVAVIRPVGSSTPRPELRELEQLRRAANA